jgi:DNA (cytosine-5)-methyltransferase 1
LYKEILEGAGYKIQADILNMAEFGVPQERYRAVALASRDFEPLLPMPILKRTQFRTVRQAIGNLPSLSSYGGADPIDPMHRTSMHRRKTVETIELVPKNGGSRPKGVGPKCLDRVKGFFDVYGRLWWDKPAITITARCRTPSCGRFTHPEQNRGLSIREAALLQGFPPESFFMGPFDDCYKQIGNAVPPQFSLVLAEHIYSLLLKENPTGRRGIKFLDEPSFDSYSILIAHNKSKKGPMVTSK